MYKVSYVYAPYPPQYFRRKADALSFHKNVLPATEVYKINIFGKCKLIATR